MRPVTISAKRRADLPAALTAENSLLADALETSDQLRPLGERFRRIDQRIQALVVPERRNPQLSTDGVFASAETAGRAAREVENG